jgi:release factor glutamine methyltransferase
MPPRTEADAASETLSAWLKRTAARLAACGIQAPSHDARRLAAHGLGEPWSAIWSRLREPMSGPMLAGLDALTDRRARGEPLAYIEGGVVFAGLELRCGPGALVPRPETETLVDVALGLLGERSAPVVADVGTGTGAVALAIAAARPGAEVWAADASPQALEYARANVRRTGLPVRVASGDLFGALPSVLRGGIDVVVANPPYVSETEAETLPPDVRAEPREALVAGPTGDEILLRLVGEAPAWLRPDGALALEVGTPEQAARLEARLTDWADRGVREDHTGRPRVVWARR